MKIVLDEMECKWLERIYDKLEMDNEEFIRRQSMEDNYPHDLGVAYPMKCGMAIAALSFVLSHSVEVES